MNNKVSLFERFCSIIANDYSDIEGKDYIEKLENWAYDVCKCQSLEDKQIVAATVRILIEKIKDWLGRADNHETGLFAPFLTVQLDSNTKKICLGDEEIRVMEASLETGLALTRDGKVKNLRPTYIPLFLYVKWGDLEKILKSNSLKVSSPRECNDLYEFLPAWSSEIEKNEILKIGAGLEQVMLCLSRTAHSSVMWGHYGDFARGALLEFKLPVYKIRCGFSVDETLFVVAKDYNQLVRKTDTKEAIYISEVSYQNERLKWAPTNNYYRYTRFAATKGIDWAHEKEMRIVFNNDEPHCSYRDGRCFSSIIMPYLSRVVLGARCAYSVKDAKSMIAQWCKDANKKYKLSVLKSSYNSKLYTLEVPTEDCPEMESIPLTRLFRLGI